jgi:DNA repair protein RadB
MPTFQSIGVHSELRTRLVTTNPKEPQPQLLETPQALLSRHPASIKLLAKTTTSTASNTNKEPQTIPLSQVYKLRQDVAEALIATSLTGKRIQQIQQQQQVGFVIPGTISALQLLNHQVQYYQQHQQYNLSTGCLALDQLLSFPPEYACTTHMDVPMGPALFLNGYVTQLYGPPASGKSQLALQVVASSCCATCTNNKSSTSSTCDSWYLSSDPALNRYAERLHQICGGGEQVPQTRFVTVTTTHQVLHALAMIEASIIQGNGNNDAPITKRGTLLVLDSASGCLSTENDELLHRVASLIKNLARHYNMAVVVTNASVQRHQQSQQPTLLRPALGRIWKKAIDIQVLVEAINGGYSRATLELHSAKQCSEKDIAKFRIEAKGIVSA